MYPVKDIFRRKHQAILPSVCKVRSDRLAWVPTARDPSAIRLLSPKAVAGSSPTLKLKDPWLELAETL